MQPLIPKRKRTRYIFTHYIGVNDDVRAEVIIYASNREEAERKFIEETGDDVYSAIASDDTFFTDETRRDR